MASKEEMVEILESFRKEIQEEIREEIRKHEVKVGWVSGVIGIVFLIGIVHSIWLIGTQVL